MRYDAVCNVLRSETSLQSLSLLSNTLRDKLKRKGFEHPTFAFPLCKQALSVGKEGAAVLKYLVLDRNAYGLLRTLDAKGISVSEMMKSIDLEGKDISSFSEREFKQIVSKDDAFRLFRENESFMNALVTEGLLSEALETVGIMALKAFDIFNAYHELIFECYEESQHEDLADNDVLNKYGASFVISYCPVIGAGANDIDGGSDRVTSFIANQDDFVYDGPLGELRQLELQDLRTLVGVMDDG